MRRRVLFITLVVAMGALFGWAGPAAAQEEEEISHEAEECIEVLEEGGEPEDCHEAPSPILPEANEIIWGSISFVVVLLLLYRFAWPGLRQGMEARSERIRDDLGEAERARQEAQAVLEEYQSQLASAREEAGRIIEESRQTADALRRDLQAKAEADIAELRQRAAADVEAAKSQAMADLQAEVGRIAIGAAELIVKNSLDPETKARLVDEYINQVTSRN
ncbi:MAG: F0F1 ATP synthase subunit B [Acidimicrobiales bacterium]